LRNYGELTPERQESLDDYVRSLEKPRLILDGQHRVFGAKDVIDEEVTIPVILLPGMPMEEQVFHFYVLNNKARPIDKTQLRAIIATSLSNKEIEHLYDRFAQAKLDADESRWTYDANTRAASPFKGLISFGLEGEQAPLKENLAHQLIARFVKMPKRYAGLYNVPQWRDPEFRLALFFATWRTVEDVYPNAWELAIQGKGNLFKKVGLVVLQDFILDTLLGVLPFAPHPPFDSEEALADAVRKSLEDRLPEEFFIKEWQEKSLDTRGGQEFLLDQMQKAATPGTTMGKLKLFREISTPG
jgi:DGQHR domain-containing protein